MYTSISFRYLYLPWCLGITVMIVMLTLPTGTGIITVPSAVENKVIAEVQFTKKKPITVITSTPPYLLSCRQNTDLERSTCSNERLMEYIYDHTAYPAGKPVHKTAGIVVADFVISPKGTVRDIRIIREPARDQGRDVMRILNEMTSNGIGWEPATLNGQPTSRRMAVTVRYNMVWAGAKPQS